MSKRTPAALAASLAVLALAGCIPIGFRASTQMIAPPPLAQGIPG